MSTQAIRAITYLKSLYQLYSVHGGKLLPLEEIVERHQVCMSCEHLVNKVCKLCGCNCSKLDHSHFNKLAFPNESCPDTPPRWDKK